MAEIDDASPDLTSLEIADLENVSDAEAEDATFTGNFSISSYGADYTVDSLVKRMKTGAFFKPDFQRQFIWNQKQSSRFIESLLMGLPVPGIFVYRTEGGKHLIIDGLQRLTTLEAFYSGIFRERRFVLTEVREPWVGKSYDTLDESDRLRLDDSVMHTTIFKQDVPESGNKSVYEIFERINTGGMKLSAQEIRVCVNYSDNTEKTFVRLLRQLNEVIPWREIYGDKSIRLKDEELILRFLALRARWGAYSRPLRGFLDEFMEDNRELTEEKWNFYLGSFSSTIKFCFDALGKRAFRPEKALNAAVYDAVMVGIAENVERGSLVAAEVFPARYDALIADPEFRRFYQRSTADEESMKNRIRAAIAAFSK